MRKRKLLLLAVFLAVLTAFLLWATRRSPEPQYEGRSLSSWLNAWASKPTMVRYHQATQAILQTGTNALPYLLQYIKYKPPAWKNITTTTFSKLTGLPLVGRLIPRSLTTDRVAARAEMAVYALTALGETAASAYPDLLGLACDATQPEAAERAVRALTWSTNALGLVLSNAPPKIRLRALHQIATWHDQTILHALRPALIQQLHDDDDNVAISAASTLTWLKHTQPEATLALFIEALGSPKPKVRTEVIKGIATFDMLALPAVPSVVPLLLDPDPLVRKEATNLLRMIAPEAITNASAH